MNAKLVKVAGLHKLGFKVHTRGGTGAGSHWQRHSSGSCLAISLECSGILADGAYCMHIQQSGRSVKTMNDKNTKKITDSWECGREHKFRFW